MKWLFKHRLGNHIIHMTRYLKYVFNDFFVIALLFLVGGVGLAYSNFLKGLRSGTWWIPLLIGIVILISVQLGRLATLTQDPDYVFLLPTDGLMKGYFKKALEYSGFNASIVQIVVWFILLPLLKIQFGLGLTGLIGWLVVMLCLKFNWLISRLDLEYQNTSWMSSKGLNDIIIPVVVVTVGMITIPWIGFVLILIWAAILLTWFDRVSSPVDWHNVIHSEDRRMHDIYTIFNMFVDVPNFGSAIVRRRYLNPLLRTIPLKKSNTYLYLFWHGFVRDKEFSNLYLRLTIIGIVLMLFMDGIIFPIIMGLVFIYLIVFQVVPFYFHFDANAFVHIYPLKNVRKLKSFRKMLWSLMIFVEILFTVSLAINQLSIPNALILLVLMTAEDYVMINVYLPRQIKKDSWKDN